MYLPITGTGAGAAPVVNLTWPFIDQSDVVARVNGTPVAYTWTGASQITFSATVPNGTPYDVIRSTPYGAPLVSFTDNAVVTGADLNLASTQLRYVFEEARSLGLGGDAGLRTDLAAPAGALHVNFNVPNSNQIFAQNGAIIFRLGDRVAVGGATVSDFAFPNTSQDWLSQLQVAWGLATGTVDSAHLSSLTNTAAGSAVGIVGASQSKYFSSAGENALGNTGYVVNNHATLATAAWAFYGEAHKITAAAGSTYFMEGDIRTLVDSVSPTPWQQGDVVLFQGGAGAGLSATGQFNASAWAQVVSNPKQFKAGLVFLHDALVDGLAVYLAAQATNPHRLQWGNAAGHGAGAITSTVVGASANGMTFTDSGLQIGGADASPVATFGLNSNSAVGLALSSNLTLFPAASATPASNGQMTWELTNNTTLKVKVKGSDGTVRSTSLTLA